MYFEPIFLLRWKKKCFLLLRCWRFRGKNILCKLFLIRNGFRLNCKKVTWLEDEIRKKKFIFSKFQRKLPRFYDFAFYNSSWFFFSSHALCERARELFGGNYIFVGLFFRRKYSRDVDFDAFCRDFRDFCSMERGRVLEYFVVGDLDSKSICPCKLDWPST